MTSLFEFVPDVASVQPNSFKRLSALGVVIAAVVVLALAGLVLVSRGEGSSEFTDGYVSVLDEPALAKDRLPAKVLALPFSAQLADSSEARLARVIGKTRLFIAPAKGDALCLIEIRPESTASACAGRSALINGAIYLAEPEEDGRTNVYGIVADEVTAVESAQVIRNVFALEGSPKSLLTMYAGETTHTLDLGPLSRQ